MDFLKNQKIFIFISISIILLGGILAQTRGLEFGIDFSGGTILEINIGEYKSADEIRTVLDDYDSSASINHFGQDMHTIQIRSVNDFSNDERNEIYNRLVDELNIQNPESGFSSSQFGPTMGKEIQRNAIMSIILSAIAMLIYITIRFKWIYGVSAIAALIHDILIVLAIYSIFQIPVNSPFVASILAVLGYSINDTIVLFDRLRYNMKYSKKGEYYQTANKSINQILKRSIITSITTLITMVALYFIGVHQIKDFALPLIVGVISGTYSSIFIASPVWVKIMEKFGAKESTFKGKKALNK